MGFGILSALTGAKARELELEVISNNLSNMQTSGYKEQHLSFASELNRVAPDNEVLAKAQASLKTGRTYLNFTPGSSYRTGNPLDFALQGDGYFTVQTPDGIRYTRNGRFNVNDEGQMVTTEGHPVLGEAGPININTNINFNVTEDGSINLEGNGVLDKLRVRSFQNQNDLKTEGNNYYSIKNPVIDETTTPAVLHEHLENSNVNLVSNMTRIIQVSRAYESLQRTMKQQIDANRMLNQLAKIS